jgi:Family of unknown function (DUF6062)
VTELPVRSLADIHLAEAFEGPGCPLCSERSRAERSSIESILAQGANDVAFRRDLDAARGFCRPHARAVLEADRRRSGGTLAAAILLRAVVAVRARELAAVAQAKGRARSKRAAEAGREPRCPVCSVVEGADGENLASVGRLSADPSWAEATAAAAFCLEHLIGLFGRLPAGATTVEIEARQLERLRLLDGELASFAHASSHDRRHLITPAQSESADAAARFLAGDG